MTLLDADGVCKTFDGLRALDDVSLTVSKGEIRAIIGPNGAGKTTFFNCLTGVLNPTEGKVSFDGSQIDGKKPSRITRAGLARTFQNIRLFQNMTVLENAMVGADARGTSTVIGSLLRTPGHRKWERESIEIATEKLDFVGLRRVSGELARNLSYGDQRRLEIARALATDPQLVLLDEPAAGMNPTEKLALVDLIRRIRDSGVTVVLIDHDMRFIMGLSERVLVLDHGVPIAEGSPAEVQKNQQVIEAYLGVQGAEAARRGTRKPDGNEE